MSGFKLYGLKSCDTCRRAQKELTAANIPFEVVDVRADGVPRETLERWLGLVGAGVLVNRKSTTWRGLSDAAKEAVDTGGAPDLLLEHPTLLKRPVIELEGKVLVGWTTGVRSELRL